MQGEHAAFTTFEGILEADFQRLNGVGELWQCGKVVAGAIEVECLAIEVIVLSVF